MPFKGKLQGVTVHEKAFTALNAGEVLHVDVSGKVQRVSLGGAK